MACSGKPVAAGTDACCVACAESGERCCGDRGSSAPTPPPGGNGAELLLGGLARPVIDQREVLPPNALALALSAPPDPPATNGGSLDHGQHDCCMCCCCPECRDPKPPPIWNDVITEPALPAFPTTSLPGSLGPGPPGPGGLPAGAVAENTREPFGGSTNCGTSLACDSYWCRTAGCWQDLSTCQTGSGGSGGEFKSTGGPWLECQGIDNFRYVYAKNHPFHGIVWDRAYGPMGSGTIEASSGRGSEPPTIPEPDTGGGGISPSDRVYLFRTEADQGAPLALAVSGFYPGSPQQVPMAFSTTLSYGASAPLSIWDIFGRGAPIRCRGKCEGVKRVRLDGWMEVADYSFEEAAEIHAIKNHQTRGGDGARDNATELWCEDQHRWCKCRGKATAKVLPGAYFGTKPEHYYIGIPTFGGWLYQVKADVLVTFKGNCSI